MSASENVFLVVGGVGFVLLLVTFLLGEAAEFAHELELHTPEGETEHPEAGVEHGDASYVPTWFSSKVLCASLVGFGAPGFATAYYGVPTFLAWLLAFVGAAALGTVVLQLVLKPLARQQSNSLVSRQSYVGSRGRVTLTIPQVGFGQVAFRDRNGAPVMETATSPDGVLKTGSRIIVIDVTPTGVVVGNDPYPVEEI